MGTQDSKLSKKEIAEIINSAATLVDSYGEYAEDEAVSRIAAIEEADLIVQITDGYYEDRLVISHEGQVVFEALINSPLDYDLVSAERGSWQERLLQETEQLRPEQYFTFGRSYEDDSYE